MRRVQTLVRDFLKTSLVPLPCYCDRANLCTILSEASGPVLSSPHTYNQTLMKQTIKVY
jgi:hypothetical protein